MAADERGLDPQFDPDAAPRVGMQGQPVLLVLGLVAAIGLGGVVFWQLNANRERIEESRLTDPAPGPALEAQPLPPPPSFLPPPPPEPETEMARSELFVPPAPSGPSPEETARLQSPSLVIDLGPYEEEASGESMTDGGPLDPAMIVGAAGAAAADAEALNPDERFATRFGVGDASRPAIARQMIDQSATIIEGAVIPAVLETALNSDLPGYVRAVVSRDVRGFDGSRVLVPRGSRLIGQYRSGVALGQSRAFVIWTRLIRPDGVGIELASPATDPLGRGGLEGDVDRHFLQRFGGAILLSLISLGVQAATDESDTSIIIASTRSGGDAAAVALASQIDQPPTVKVPQGAPVRVFVSQDLDFSQVEPIP
jgi:type IV secretion system protein VirB10